MNWEILTNSKFVENLGWTLVHSVWQIVLIAFVLFLIFQICNKLSANARYLFAVAALGFAFVIPLVTFVQLASDSAKNQFSDKIFATETSNSPKNDVQQPDNFTLSTNNKLQIANSPNEKTFLSFANLRESLRQNLASALPMFVSLWIFGVGIFAFRLCGGVWQLHKFKTREISFPEKHWQERFSALCGKLRIAQTVKLLQSSSIETPVVIGWLKPLILVPTSVFLQMNPQQLETILAHELIHIRRYDNLVNFAQSFVEILFFYHPCVWWISVQVRREREFACDDAVTETPGNPHIVYASALADLEEIRRLTKEKTPSLIMAASGGKLMQRINRILEKNTERQNSKQTLWSASLAFVLISAVLTTVFWTDSSFDVNAQSKSKDKKMAIGFVSIPPNYRENSDKSFDETARLLIEKLTAHRIPAIGFVNGGSILQEQHIRERIESLVAPSNTVSNSLNEKTLSNPAEVARMRSVLEKLRAQQSMIEKTFTNRADVVRMWRDAGLEVGIGNFNHVWFYDTSYDEYVAGVEKNERLTRQILAERNLPLTFFSYPYLNTGKTAEDKIRFENWLTTQGLRSVKYTFDNQEWMYSFAYDEAREKNDLETAQRVKTEFLDYMTKMLEHYEAYSQEMFKRDIAQTLVLTPSRLVADTADELFGLFEERGYKFVSTDEAQADAAYQTEEKFVAGKSGISWFERWQMAQNKKLRDEPRVSKLVADAWDNRKDKSGPLPPKPPPPPTTPPPRNKMP